MSGAPFVLLPPSEAKADGGVGHDSVGSFDERLADARREVVRALHTLLQSADRGALERTLGVRGPLLERALFSSRNIVEGTFDVLPAWRRYTGVVWSHLDPASLSEAMRSRLLIPSGLCGITSGNDPVPDYRLKMSASLSPLGTLATHWRPILAPALIDHVRGAAVVDLLPHEHARAFDIDQLRASCEVHRVSFVRHDGARAIGHEAKAVKGEVARAILRDGWSNLAKFRWNGWKAHRHHGEIRIVAPRS